MTKNLETDSPDIQLDVRQMFDIDVDMKVPGFSEANEYENCRYFILFWKWC